MEQVTRVEFTHFHLFCGLGGAARGFNRAHARVGTLEANWRCLGGIDNDSEAIKDFDQLAGVKGTCMDLFDRDQYIHFHGHQPPADWREATPADVLQAAGCEFPTALVLSPPCKGFSGLLPESKSLTTKYQALNRLTIRGIWLAMEAFRDHPPKLVLLENVPRLANRGRSLVDQIKSLLQSFGYAVAETTHDCGELGALAQSRKRFLLVARHLAQVPPMLYEPAKHSLRAVGEVLGKMLLPGDQFAGPMHRIPSLAWKTWVRLAFVEAGSDWRSLNKLRVDEGVLQDYLIVPEMHRGTLGVRSWEEHSGTVTGNARAMTGAFSVADVRFKASAKWHDGQAYGVRRWDETMGTVAGQQSPGQGAYAVADIRHQGAPKHSNEFAIVPWERPSRAVTSAHGSGACVADPRPSGSIFGKYAVVKWDKPAGTVIAGSTTGQGAFAVSDPRSGMDGERSSYLTGGHYGVIPWTQACGAVSGAACHDNGRWSVADPRMPSADEKTVAVIRSLDGTWHRPFTTLELAALQSLWDPEQHLIDAEIGQWERANGRLAHSKAQMMVLSGESDSSWRERIGNAIPPASAEAIGSEMARTLLLAHSGETFQLSNAPIWVRPLALAISVAHTSTF